jgi:hypothetical protein
VTPVVINADDYAMDQAVDAAIRDLARRGVVTAASAMTLSPSWPEAGRRLGDLDLDRGLHLDLTSPFAEGLSPVRSLPRLIASAHLGRLARPAIRVAIDRQLDRFDAAMTAPPQFVDGHQHVHHLPVVREELIAALAERYGPAAGRIGIRLCAPHRWRGGKAAAVAATGAAGMAVLARGRHPANSDFAGVYDFSPRASLARLWRQWLSGLRGARPLIMCHVAAADGFAQPADPIRPARIREWEWLQSASFAELCCEMSVKPRRWLSQGTGGAFDPLRTGQDTASTVFFVQGGPDTVFRHQGRR